MKKLLKAFTWFVGIVFILSVLSIDSPSGLPILTAAASGIYLMIYGHFDGWYEPTEESEEQ